VKYMAGQLETMILKLVPTRKKGKTLGLRITEALVQVAQRDCGLSVLGDIQGQIYITNPISIQC